MITPMTGIISPGFFICPAEKNKTTGQRCKARADSNPHGELLARAFSFALGLEVIAHGTATAQTLPSSWMPGTVA